VLQWTARHPDREDEIHWKWTSSGEYTTKSAYQIQFDESFAKIKIFPIWKARAETLLHPEILTPNNLSKRNWLHDPICKLCGIELETPNHLCKDCPYSKQVWSQLKRWLHLSVLDSVAMTGSIHGFWRKCRAKFYFWWNVWKERNRRTFQQKSLQPNQVALLCKDDIQRYQFAARPTVQQE